MHVQASSSWELGRLETLRVVVVVVVVVTGGVVVKNFTSRPVSSSRSGTSSRAISAFHECDVLSIRWGFMCDSGIPAR